MRGLVIWRVVGVGVPVPLIAVKRYFWELAGPLSRPINEPNCLNVVCSEPVSTDHESKIVPEVFVLRIRSVHVIESAIWAPKL